MKVENRGVNENLSWMPISKETSSSRRNPSADLAPGEVIH
jgi:hypothetical protein